MRARGLPVGWYPGTEEEIRSLIRRWRAENREMAMDTRTVEQTDSGIRAAVVPHAGWGYCGRLIAGALAGFSPEIQTVAVLGGHNPPGCPLISYREQGWTLPSGVMEADTDFLEAVESLEDPELPSADEQSPDNTVEVVMAMAASFFPRARWVAWRVPADERAVAFGRRLNQARESLGRRADTVAVIGSTDLSHYGPNFGFMPPESRANPALWVESRDRRILEAFAVFGFSQALTLATEERSACSAGGAVAAASYAREAGAEAGRILDYHTSLEIQNAPSFVGYGSVVWE